MKKINFLILGLGILALITLSVGQQIYQPWQTYEKTFYVTPNITATSSSTLRIVQMRAIFKGMIPKTSSYEEIDSITNGISIPITITYNIPIDATSGTYVAIASIGIVEKNQPNKIVSSEYEDFYVAGVITTTTTSVPITTTTTTTIPPRPQPSGEVPLWLIGGAVVLILIFFMIKKK